MNPATEPDCPECANGVPHGECRTGWKTEVTTHENSINSVSQNNKMPRGSWHEYFMDIASQVSTRATCARGKVGALLVRDRTVLSTGYNGSIRGLPHCTDVGCYMRDGHCVLTIHAEANAIIQAAKNGVGIDGATLYTTTFPCWNCFKSAANAGVTSIIFQKTYRMDELVYSAAQVLKIEFKSLAVAVRGRCDHSGIGLPGCWICDPHMKPSRDK